MFRKKFLVLAQSIGPIRTKLGKILLKIGLKMTDAITVRDALSLNLLSQLGISPVLAADPTFAIDIIKCKESYNAIMSDNITIGVVLRAPIYFETNKPQNFEDIVANTLDYVINKFKAEIVFVPMWNSKSKSTHDDYTLVNLVFAKMKNQKNAKILSDITSPKQLINLFAKFDVLLGIPLHSLIFSTIANTPFIAVNYHPKIEGYINCINYDKKLMLCVDQLDAATCQKKSNMLCIINTILSVICRVLPKY